MERPVLLPLPPIDSSKIFRFGSENDRQITKVDLFAFGLCMYLLFLEYK